MTVKLENANHEKKIAPRPFRKGKPLQFYADDEVVDRIDEWAKQQPGRVLTRSEAIRRLLDLGLTVPPKGGKR